jgi:O-antigen ligase
LHFPPWVSWHGEAVAFFSVLVFSWVGLVWVARKNLSGRIAFPFAALPLLALGLLVWLQSAAGLITFGGDALVTTQYLALCVASMALGFFICHQEDSPRLLAWTLLAAAFFSSIVALVQVFDVWESSQWISRMPQLRRPGGNLGQPNQLATLQLMGLASLLFLFESRKLRALPSGLLALCLLMALAATESRTGILSYGAMVVWWFMKHKSCASRLSSWVIASLFLGFMGLFWIWPQIVDAVQVTGTSGVAAHVNTGTGTRWLVWSQLMEAVLLRPWWGWGLGQVSTAHNAVAHAYAISEPFSYSHNIVLDLALGMGLPLTLFAVAGTAFWLWRRARAANDLVLWYCLILMLPVAVHSMLEFPFAYAYFLAPVMCALGILEGRLGAKPAFHLGVKPVVVGLLLGTAVMAWSVVEYIAIEEDFRVVRFESLRVGKTPTDYERPHIVLLTQLDALLEAGRIVPAPNLSPERMELLRKVALRFPWTATQNRYALSLALNGNPQEALRLLKVMRAMHGAKTFEAIRDNWKELAATQYPQLGPLQLP